jgi:2-amino-4-hydroxy-6-hydroxymethyldihydropteridine diphosphokinase
MLNVVYISLGGNIGDPIQAIKQALKKIDDHEKCTLQAVSSFWNTPPWGVVDQPDFINACAKLTTSLTPQQFLDICLCIERDLLRVRDAVWGPRTIDIDILLFGSIKITEKGLIIPHPQLTKRAFVLVPLAEIAPKIMCDGLFIADWAISCNKNGMYKINQ